ncbi:MAG: hypothetical protein IRY97_09360, partial [Thermomicrobiaceae bacterium]|nr:hypothetical protein [Thermomicrobiaceae bacterium]
YEAASELPTAWIFPACLTFGLVALLEMYHSPVAVGAVALLAFGGIAAGMVLHHHLFDPSEPARQRARALYTILVHGVAFLALSMVYVNKVRSLFSATAVLVIGLLLLLQLTDGEDVLFARRLVYALVGGLMLGQVTWVLNYWEAVGWTGGAALLVVFYFAAGLIATQLHRGVGARDVLEYGGIAALALAIVVYSILA